MYRIIMLVVFLRITPLFAQFDDYKSSYVDIPYPLLMQHYDNKVWYNPAAITEGEDKVYTIAISPNKTTNGYTSTFTYELPSNYKKYSFALQLNNYSFGTYRHLPMQSIRLDSLNKVVYDTFVIKNVNLLEGAFLISRTYHFGAENKLSFGLQGMLRRFNFSALEPEGFSTPKVNIGAPIYKPDVNIGVQYKRRKLYAGFSLRNIFAPGYSETALTKRSYDSNGYNVHVFSASHELTAFFTAGNTFTLSENIDLQSSILIITDERNMLGINLDLNNSIIYKNKAKIGFSLRDPSIYNATMGLKYGSRKDIPDKHTFNFTNYALNSGITIGNTDVGAALNFQDYTGMDLSSETGWKINAWELYLKARI